jgi:hypothetical protein
MSLTEWAEDLAYTLRNSGHGLEQITLASAGDPPGFSVILDTARRIAAASGWPVMDDVAKYSTDVLVRGYSGRWKYGSYGDKEKQVAEMQKAGHHIKIIDAEGFLGLRSHYPAPALKPNVPDAPARAAAAEGGVVGAPYRADSFAGPLQGDGEHYRDPDVMERG